jgi:hypothetical protein
MRHEREFQDGQDLMARTCLRKGGSRIFRAALEREPHQRGIPGRAAAGAAEGAASVWSGS